MHTPTKFPIEAYGFYEHTGRPPYAPVLTPSQQSALMPLVKRVGPDWKRMPSHRVEYFLFDKQNRFVFTCKDRYVILHPHTTIETFKRDWQLSQGTLATGVTVKPRVTERMFEAMLRALRENNIQL